jgi:hypothetical protein
LRRWPDTVVEAVVEATEDVAEVVVVAAATEVAEADGE